VKPHYFGRSPEGEERNKKGNSSLVEDLPVEEDAQYEAEEVTVLQEADVPVNQTTSTTTTTTPKL
jgi:hypothetical protein